MLGIPIGDVLIVVYWRLSTLIQYLTWFGKSPISTGKVHIIRDEKRIQYTYMKEKDHFTQIQLSLLSHTAAHDNMVAALGNHSFFSLTLSLHFTHSLSLCFQIMLLFIDINSKARDHNLWHKWWQHM